MPRGMAPGGIVPVFLCGIGIEVFIILKHAVWVRIDKLNRRRVFFPLKPAPASAIMAEVPLIHRHETKERFHET